MEENVAFILSLVKWWDVGVVCIPQAGNSLCKCRQAQKKQTTTTTTKECVWEIITVQLIQPSFTECQPCTKKDITWLPRSSNAGRGYLD